MSPEQLVQELQKRLLSADFDAARALIDSHLRWENLTAIDEILALRLRAMASEVYDHAGRYGEAEEVIRSDGKRCERLLRNMVSSNSGVPQSLKERRLLKQRIWIVLHWGFVFYRSARFPEARSRFRLCWHVAENYLTADKYRANGTFARIHYLLGLTDREVYDYHAAKHHFAESIAYAWKALDEQENGVPKGRQAILTDLNIARCLGLGLAWVHYSEGSTTLAIPLLLAAKTILSIKEDKLITSYIDVVYASALRSDGGHDPVKLSDVMKLLYKGYRVFRAKGHRHYTLRAAHQLARAYLQRARNARAQRASAVERKSLRYARAYARRVIHLAADLSDSRFACGARVIYSQIALQGGQLLDAEDYARVALEEGYEDIFCRIEALIARGAARLALGNCSGGCKNFEDALDVGGDNPKVAAMCHLLLARGYALSKNLRRSSQHWEEWQKLMPRVNTAYMRKLADEATAARKRETTDFVIEWSSRKVDPRSEERRLHAFLVKWAKDQTETDEAAISLLGISKQTFYNWQSGNPKERVVE
jgi:tetratricopeptide (TPR) repeat protein